MSRLLPLSLFVMVMSFAGCRRAEPVKPPVAVETLPAIQAKSGGELLLIPAGSFTMGDAGGREDETPHPVSVSAFYLDKVPVTQELYAKIMGANPSKHKGPTLPVERVQWIEAVRFCNKCSELEGLTPCYNLDTWECNFAADGYRLPTEAEWEYACRAGSTGRWGFDGEEKELSKYGWFKPLSQGVTHPVGTKTPNRWGLFDMHGNVWQWCNDWYGDAYYKDSPKEDPRGPATGKTRVMRGGAWDTTSEKCRAAYRHKDFPANGDICFGSDPYGFRRARSKSVGKVAVVVAEPKAPPEAEKKRQIAIEKPATEAKSKTEKADLVVHVKDCKVEVIKWAEGRVGTHNAGGEIFRDDKGISFLVRVSNTSPNKVLYYDAWNLSSATTLHDNFGNEFRKLTSNRAEWFVFENRPQLNKQTRIDPGMAIEDILVFDYPTAKTEKLVLKLPGESVGSPLRMIEFRLPRVMKPHGIGVLQPYLPLRKEPGPFKPDLSKLKGAVLKGTIIFVSDRGGSMKIWSMHASGKNPKQLTKSEGADADPRFSPDGKRILYTTLRGGFPEVWLMNRDGSDAKIITKGSQGSWSPDGKAIVFINDNQTFVRDLDTGKERLVTPKTWERCGVPAFSPDGKRIAVASRHTGSIGIFLLGKDGKEIAPLKTEEACCTPAWSQDGKKILYQTVNGHIHEVGIDGKGADQLTFGADVQHDARYSPDGAMIVFCRAPTPDGPWQICVQKLDGEEGEFVTLTKEGSNLLPDWYGGE